MVFQQLDAPRERGLNDAKRYRRSREAALTGDLDKIAKGDEVHVGVHASLDIMVRYGFDQKLPF